MFLFLRPHMLSNKQLPELPVLRNGMALINVTSLLCAYGICNFQDDNFCFDSNFITRIWVDSKSMMIQQVMAWPQVITNWHDQFHLHRDAPPGAFQNSHNSHHKTCMERWDKGIIFLIKNNFHPIFVITAFYGMSCCGNRLYHHSKARQNDRHFA